MSANDDLIAALGHTDIYLLDHFMKGRLTEPQRVLDAGCGAGRNLDLLLPAYEAQRQNGTAFGGFPKISETGAGYGTLETNTATPAAYSATAVAYPKSTASTAAPIVVELRSSIIARCSPPT